MVQTNAIFSREICFPSLNFSKGISQSALPYRRSVPSWLKLNADDVKEQIKKLGKKGMTPSQIGKLLRLCSFIQFMNQMSLPNQANSIADVQSNSMFESKSNDLFFSLCFFMTFLFSNRLGIILRDSHGVAQVRFVSGNKILRILKSLGLRPDIPEDLYYLIKKAVAIRKHLERNRKDKDSKFRLILVESRIHRLARFYKTKSVLPPAWKYESSTASALVA